MKKIILPPRWGHLFLDGQYRRPIMGQDLQGNLYEMDSHGPLVLQLRCECGFSWEMLSSDFPGRRRLKTCERPECVFNAKKPPPRPKERGAAYCVYFSKSFADQVTAYGQAHGLRFSRALEELGREGLVTKMINE